MLKLELKRIFSKKINVFAIKSPGIGVVLKFTADGAEQFACQYTDNL